MSRVSELLGISAEQNAWANRGPLYKMARQAFTQHLGLRDTHRLVPVSNGGVALELMARLHAARAGRKLRWVASAYSFQNLGRGYFSDVTFVDCDEHGKIDAVALAALDPDSFDGVIATNPFGLFRDVSAVGELMARQGKPLLIDNASGLHSVIADVSWQAFSLHHTKPHGMGEGGLALVPAEAEEELYALANYAPDLPERDREHWFENGKLSDISCAFVIDRLEQLPNWGPQGLEQRERVIDIAGSCGLMPLHRPETDIPMTSMPFVSDGPIALEAIDTTVSLTCTKYYRPLADLPRVTDIFQRLVNVPCHKDVAEVSDAQIRADIYLCLEQSAKPVKAPPRTFGVALSAS